VEETDLVEWLLMKNKESFMSIPEVALGVMTGPTIAAEEEATIAWDS
jgi:hypothetical protein